MPYWQCSGTHVCVCDGRTQTETPRQKIFPEAPPRYGHAATQSASPVGGGRQAGEERGGEGRENLLARQGRTPRTVGRAETGGRTDGRGRAIWEAARAQCRRRDGRRHRRRRQAARARPRPQSRGSSRYARFMDGLDRQGWRKCHSGFPPN